MMRVLFFSPVPDFKGGAEISLFDLLRNPQVTPLLLVPSEGPLADAARAEGLEVRTLELGEVAAIRRPLKLGTVFKAFADWIAAARALKSLCRSERIDIVHSNGMKAHAVAVLARRLGGAPSVVHVRDIAVTRPERWVWRALGALSDRMVLVSRPCWPGDVLPDRVKVIHNGLDPARLPSVPGNGSGRLTLGFCGRLHPFKGVDTLLNWVAAARDRGLDFDLIVRGEAAPDDADYEVFLHDEARRLALGDRVRFDGKRTGLDAIYAGLDVVVVPSVVPDPLPRSVMEAMGLGFPVIGYPAGGIPDMITPGETGWLVADADGFGAVIEDLLSHPESIRTFGDRARAAMLAGFTLDALHSQLNSLYRSVAGIGRT